MGTETRSHNLGYGNLSWHRDDNNCYGCAWLVSHFSRWSWESLSCGLIGSELGVPGTLGYVQTEDFTQRGCLVYSVNTRKKNKICQLKYLNLFGTISLVLYLKQLSFSYLSNCYGTMFLFYL